MYLLDLPPEAIDSRRFELAGESGRARLQAGDPAGAARELRAALDLWRGASLPDLVGVPGAAASVARLQSLRLSVLADRIDAESLLGQHSRLIPQLQDLVRRYPLNERFVGQLMTSLYWDGRQAEALATYAAAADRLGDELGIDPVPVLRELHGRLLRQEVGPTATTGPADLPKPESDSAVPFARGFGRRIAPPWSEAASGPVKSPLPEPEFGSCPGTLPTSVLIPGPRSADLRAPRSDSGADGHGIGALPGQHRDFPLHRSAGPDDAPATNGFGSSGYGPSGGSALEAGPGGRPGAGGRTGPAPLGREPVRRAVPRPACPVEPAAPVLPGHADLPDPMVADVALDAPSELPGGLGRPAFGTAPTAGTIGRAGELEAGLDLLCRPDVRLLTLVGPGGAGKSRLAAQLITRHLTEGCARPDPAPRVLVVPLRATGAEDVPVDRENLAVRLARLLGAVPDTPGQDPAETVCRSLAAGPALLVLDDLDDVGVERTATLTRLLTEVGGLRVLATARRPLGIPGEHVVGLGPLPLPWAGCGPQDLPTVRAADAVRLFRDRARAVSPAFEVAEENAAAVGRLCRIVDGLPLALELVAARSREHRPAEIADDLATALAALPPRAPGEALNAVLDWSVGLLDETERLVFAQLSVFAGGATLEAAERVCGPVPPPGQVIDVIGRLADKNLLLIDESGRLGLLAPVHAQARRMLAADPEQQIACADRHAAYFAEVADAVVPITDRWPDRPTWSGPGPEHDNLAAAAAHAQRRGGEVFARLAVALLDHGHPTGRWDGHGVTDWLNRAQAHRPTARTGARLLLAAGGLSLLGGDPGAAERILARIPAGAATGEVGPVTAVRVALIRALVARSLGSPSRALAELQAALTRMRATRSVPDGLWHAVVCSLADVLDDLGRTGEAIGHWQRARHRAAADGDPARLAYPLSRLAGSAQERGEGELAEVLLAQATTAAATAGPGTRAQVAQAAGVVQLLSGADQAAQASLRLALRAAHACGQFVLLPQITGLLAAAHRPVDPHRAAALLAAAAAWSSSGGPAVVGRRVAELIEAARVDLPVDGPEAEAIARSAARGAALPFGSLRGVLQIDLPDDLRRADPA